MSETTNTINNTISLLRAGEAFYRDAVERVKEPGLKEMFSEMAAIRNAAATEMSVRIEALGESPSAASWAEQARQIYAEAEALFSNETNALIRYLEEHEDRTLDQIRSSLSKIDDDAAFAIFMRHLPIFEQTHDRMRLLKESLDA